MHERLLKKKKKAAQRLNMKSEECSFWKSPDKKNNTGIRNITSNVFFFYLDDFKKCFKMVKNLELLGTVRDCPSPKVQCVASGSDV